MKNCYEDGGLIPGEAEVEGNSPKNDTVEIKVSPGEIVVDRETISKGPEAILHFIMEEMQKHPHVFKKNFYEGGMSTNPKQIAIAEQFGAKPAQAPSAGADIYKPEDEEFKQLSAAYTNVGPARMSPKMLDRLRILNAQRQYQMQQQPTQQVIPTQQDITAKPGFAEGGTVAAFDPDKYLANKTSSFDPDKYLEQKVGKKESSFGDKAQTALENYGQAMTLGYLPQIQAATEPITAKIFNAVTGENVEADPYLKARDENIKRINEESERNPKSALAGTAAGFLGSAVVAPELPILKGAGAIKNIARGAITGAGYGAAQNPGDVPGEVTPLQSEERFKNLKTGGALGAAVGTAGSAIGKGASLLKGSADAARETANTQAVRAAGAMLKDMRVLNANDKIDDIGKFALDNGIVKSGYSVKDVAEKSDIVRESAGKKLDEIYQIAQKSLETNPNAAKIKGFSPFHAKEEILSSVEEKLGDSIDKKESLRAVRKYLNQLIEDYGDKELTPKIANNIKTKLDQKINYARNPMTKNPAAEEGFSIMRDYVNNSVKNHIDEIGKVLDHDELAKELTRSNKEYGYAKQLQNMAEDRVSREIANRSFSLTDTIAGIGGATAGAVMGSESGHGIEGAALGLLAGGVNKLARTAGPGAVAQIAHKAEPILEKTAVPLGKMLEKAPKEVLQKAAIMDAASLAKGGPKKWSNDGYSVLYSHVDKEDKEYLKSMKDKLVSDPKSQRLLIEASALKHGSKKLDKIIADLKELKK